MPVEYVRAVGFPEDDDETEVLAKVAWGENYVQVASVGRIPVTHEQVGPSEGDGWYVTLDRRGINDLIRKLKKARNRVYGRDE